MKLTLINLFEIFSTLFYYRDIYLSNFTLIWKKVRLERKRNNAHAIPKMTECVVNQSLERKILGGRKKKEEEEFSKNRAELKGHRFGHCSWGRLKKDKEKKGRKKKKNRIVQGNSRQFEVALLRRTAFLTLRLDARAERIFSSRQFGLTLTCTQCFFSSELFLLRRLLLGEKGGNSRGRSIFMIHPSVACRTDPSQFKFKPAIKETVEYRVFKKPFDIYIYEIRNADLLNIRETWTFDTPVICSLTHTRMNLYRKDGHGRMPRDV